MLRRVFHGVGLRDERLTRAIEPFCRLPDPTGRSLRARWLTRRRREGQAQALDAFEVAVGQLGPDHIVLDLGAHKGVFTHRLTNTGATVHAYEPDPALAAEVRAAFADVPNVTVHEAAVSTETKTPTMRRHADYHADPEFRSTANSIEAAAVETEGGEMLNVHTMAFRDILNAIPCEIMLIKMDIEGSEVAILEDLLDHGGLERIRYFFAETHERQMPMLLDRTFELHRRTRHMNPDKFTLLWP